MGKQRKKHFAADVAIPSSPGSTGGPPEDTAGEQQKMENAVVCWNEIDDYFLEVFWAFLKIFWM